MLKEYLKKQTESTLWLILADIAAIMGERTAKNYTTADSFWLSVSSEIKNELDARLFDLYNGDNANDEEIMNEK